MKIITLDVSRTFAQVAILESGKFRDAGRIELDPEHILKFAKRLNVEDEIVLERSQGPIRRRATSAIAPDYLVTLRFSIA